MKHTVAELIAKKQEDGQWIGLTAAYLAQAEKLFVLWFITTECNAPEAASKIGFTRDGLANVQPLLPSMSQAQYTTICQFSSKYLRLPDIRGERSAEPACSLIYH